MTKAFINERKIGLPNQGDEIVPIHGACLRKQTVTFTTTTQSNAMGDGTQYIDFTVTANAHYEMGLNPTATTASSRINATERIQETIPVGHKIAFIDASD